MFGQLKESILSDLEKTYQEKGEKDFKKSFAKYVKVLKENNVEKNGHYFDVLKYTPEELISHLEKQFKDGMTWDNYGIKGWHIDHIIPCCKFDLTLESEQRKCFH